MKAANTLLLTTAIIELILGIPLLGGALVLFSGYSLLFMTLILHVVTLVICSQHNKLIMGSVFGIITSVLGMIPILGMILHLTTAVILFSSASRKNNYPAPPPPPAPNTF